MTMLPIMSAGVTDAQGGQSKQWNQRIDEKTMQRRQEQREAYLSKEGTTNQTNWIGLAFGLILLPAFVILGYAIQSGFLDQVRWRLSLSLDALFVNPS